MKEYQIGLIQEANRTLIASMDDTGKAMLESLCETVKPLVELCNKRPEFVDQAAIAYYRVMTVKHDVMYRAVVTAALYIQGADYEAMKLAIQMTIRDEN